MKFGRNSTMEKSGIFFAGIQEIALVMHTDCGCCLQGNRILIPCNDVDWQLESDLISGS